MYKKLSLFVLAATLSTQAHAEISPSNSGIKDKEGIISISFENDFFANEDDNYTNGFRISYLSPETVPNWLEQTADFLPLMDTSGNKRWGFQIGQSIYTPADISLNPPNPRDEPYAGWLYGTALLMSDNDTGLDTFGVTLGVVGPDSHADDVQSSVHRMMGYQEPQGWRYQLHDEPGVIVSYDHKWRNIFEASPFGLGFDITPSWGANLGNVDTSGNVALMARLGRDLPSDYGPPLIGTSVGGSEFFIPTKKFGWYFFGGIQGQAVARNIFLDGNTVGNSPSVDKNIFVGGLQTGVAITWSDFRLAYTQVFKTPEFKGEVNDDNYGAISLSWRF